MTKPATIFLSMALTLLAASCTGQDRYVRFTGYAQGGQYSVKANLRGVKRRPAEIAGQIDTILSHIDRSLSGYNHSSLLSRFNSGQTITPDKYFIDIYSKSYHFYKLSEGAFDVACGPLFDVWGFGFRSGEAPGQAAIDSARSISGMAKLKENMQLVIKDDGSLRPADLANDGREGTISLNFNAIAQGYSCDVIAEYLRSIGVRDMLVDIGEIYCSGVNPSGKPWTIGIDRPVDGNNSPGADIEGIWKSTGDCGVVTSGNYRKFYIRNGRKYSHTIDPRTGCPVTHNLLSATIIAPDATTADAVATWCMVVGKDKALEIVKNLDLEACLLYSDDNGGIQAVMTEGFVLE